MQLRQAVRNAVMAERAAGMFYRRLAEKDVSLAVREFFEDMAAQEDAHAKSIEDMGNRLTGGDLAQYADSDVSMIETAPNWDYADNITPEQALQIALEAERQAALYYDAIADSGDGEVKTFFSQLAKTEEEHIRKLEGLGPIR